MDSEALITAYFNAFNAGDAAAMLALLDDGVEHHVNEGKIRRGKPLFAEFYAHRARCYEERLSDIAVFTNRSGDRAAAEFTVSGTYVESDPGLPPARGQTYRLPAGAFFTIRDGKIARLTTYYNLTDWTAQVCSWPRHRS